MIRASFRMWRLWLAERFLYWGMLIAPKHNKFSNLIFNCVNMYSLESKKLSAANPGRDLVVDRSDPWDPRDRAVILYGYMTDRCIPDDDKLRIVELHLEDIRNSFLKL